MVRLRAAQYQETVWEAVRGGRVVETLAVVQEAIRAAEPLLALDGEDADRAFAGHARKRSGAVDVDRLAGELATGAVLLLDVRDDDEWRDGHVPGSAHLPLERLREAAHMLPAVPIVTACSGGPRAAAAASALRRLGHRNIWRVADGGVPDLLARPLGLDLLGAA